MEGLRAVIRESKRPRLEPTKKGSGMKASIFLGPISPELSVISTGSDFSGSQTERFSGNKPDPSIRHTGSPTPLDALRGETLITTVQRIVSTSCKGTEFSVDSKSDLQIQVVFEFLRSIGEPCTLFGESYDRRINRVRQILKVDSYVSRRFQKGDANTNIIPSLNIDEIFDFRGKDQEGGRILGWARSVLHSWQGSLQTGRSSPTEYRLPFSEDYTLFQQTIDGLKPLVLLIQSETLDSHVLSSLHKLVSFAEQGHFSDANSQFLKLSIGNKPWPIGVGNCFIQERASMDRIATSTHLLNDECTRRYIQTIKRLLTKAEELKLHPTPS